MLCLSLQALGQEGPFSVVCSPTKPQEHIGIWVPVSAKGFPGAVEPKASPSGGEGGCGLGGQGPGTLERTTSREAVRASEIPSGWGSS